MIPYIHFVYRNSWIIASVLEENVDGISNQECVIHPSGFASGQVSFTDDVLGDIEEFEDAFYAAESHRRRTSSECEEVKDGPGGEAYTWGTNVNFTLGHKTEASKQYPERIVCSRPITFFSVFPFFFIVPILQFCRSLQRPK
jgi:hypothetical protein